MTGGGCVKRSCAQATPASRDSNSTIHSALTAATVDALFAGAMTVQMDLSGAAKLATDASITCNMRLFGVIRGGDFFPRLRSRYCINNVPGL
jgi:hypothetical protein